jgi:hypothetical protein
MGDILRIRKNASDSHLTIQGRPGRRVRLIVAGGSPGGYPTVKNHSLVSPSETQYPVFFRRKVFKPRQPIRALRTWPHACDRRAHLTDAELASRSSSTLKFEKGFAISTFFAKPCGSQWKTGSPEILALLTPPLNNAAFGA